MSVTVPKDFELAEIEREQTYWVKVEKTDTLWKFIKQELRKDVDEDAEATFNEYLAEDWYFYDRKNAEGDFDSDRFYSLGLALEEREVEDDGIAYPVHLNVLRSLREALRGDGDMDQLTVRFSVETGNEELESAVEPMVIGRRLKIEMPDLKARLERGQPRVTVAWEGTDVEAGRDIFNNPHYPDPRAGGGDGSPVDTTTTPPEGGPAPDGPQEGESALSTLGWWRVGWGVLLTMNALYPWWWQALLVMCGIVGIAVGRHYVLLREDRRALTGAEKSSKSHLEQIGELSKELRRRDRDFKELSARSLERDATDDMLAVAGAEERQARIQVLLGVEQAYLAQRERLNNDIIQLYQRAEEGIPADVFVAAVRHIMKTENPHLAMAEYDIDVRFALESLWKMSNASVPFPEETTLLQVLQGLEANLRDLSDGGDVAVEGEGGESALEGEEEGDGSGESDKEESIEEIIKAFKKEIIETGKAEIIEALKTGIVETGKAEIVEAITEEIGPDIIAQLFQKANKKTKKKEDERLENGGDGEDQTPANGIGGDGEEEPEEQPESQTPASLDGRDEAASADSVENEEGRQDYDLELLEELLSHAQALSKDFFVSGDDRQLGLRATVELKKLKTTLDFPGTDPFSVAQRCLEVLAPLWIPPEQGEAFCRLFTDDRWHLVYSDEQLQEVTLDELDAWTQVKLQKYLALDNYRFKGRVVLEPGIEWKERRDDGPKHPGKEIEVDEKVLRQIQEPSEEPQEG